MILDDRKTIVFLFGKKKGVFDELCIYLMNNL